jgi:hydroxymethylbilane synthase
MSQSHSSGKLHIGTRGSKLARVQTDMVQALLSRGGTDCEVIPLKTSGDRIQDRSLADAGGKGLFTKELGEALLDGRIDLAVHSMKDVPTIFPDGLGIAALLPREDPRDAFLSHKAKSLADLPKGARIGTSSVRRQAQVMRARSDLEVVLLRGNVDTRLAKLDDGIFDAILLAYAGLKRLGLGARATSLLLPDEWLPALGQGAVGIEIRKNDARTLSVVGPLNDSATATALACERAFQSALDGSCRTPIGGLAIYANSKLTFRGEVLAPDGSDVVTAELNRTLGSDAVHEAEDAGRELGLELRPRVARWLED